MSDLMLKKQRIVEENFDTIVDSEFAKDVVYGLSQPQKRLSSKYFYNDAGSQLFDLITEQPEYYLTRAETDIIQKYGSQFFTCLEGTPFNLFELGCGNGDKTFNLIENMLSAGQHFSFYPMDISKVAIDGLVKNLHQSFPLLNVQGQLGDYHQFLAQINTLGKQQQNVVLFLGSNIGNYTPAQAAELLGDLKKGLNSGDLLLIGMDLKKDFDRMTAAYNDKNKVTEKFNLNLLSRMNEELGANFDVNKFNHYEIYNPLDNAMQSFLVAIEKQSISLSTINLDIEFDAFETLFVESSHKYSFRDIEILAHKSGFEVVESYTDDKQDFVDSLWRRL